MHTAPTDLVPDTHPLDNVGFSYEYVTLVLVQYGDHEWRIPIRVQGRAAGNDLHTTISNHDGTNTTVHVTPGGAHAIREMLLPRVLSCSVT